MKYDAIKKVYQDTVGKQLADIQQHKYYRYVIVAALGLFVLGGAAYSYRWWSQRAEQNAQKALSECVYAYHQALEGKDESWSHVSMLCSFGYEQHKSSSLAPYFKVFYADAVLREGDTQKALETLDEAITSLPTNSPFVYVYKTKQALMRLDAEDNKIQEEGLTSLRELADNKENKNRDFALYYLGLYYWSQDAVAEATKVWQTLVDDVKHEKFGQSPWAQMAESKLEQIA